jgi:hypothetical protein
LAAGAASGEITPPADTPVYIIANCTTVGDRGTGFVSLERAAGSFLEWSGDNSTTGVATPPTLTGGFSGVSGTVILAFDFNNTLTLQVGPSGDKFRIVNNTGAPATGVVWMQTAPPTVPAP